MPRLIKSSNTGDRIKTLARLYSEPVDRATGIICDQTIALNAYRSSYRYPDDLRRIRFKDPDTDQTLLFLCKQ